MNVLTLHVLCYFLTISRHISSKIHPQARFLNELTCQVKLADTKQLNFASCKCKTAALFSMNCWSLVPLLFGEAKDTSLLLFFEIFIYLGCFPSFLVILDQIPSLNIPFWGGGIEGLLFAGITQSLYPYSFPFPNKIFAGKYYPIIHTTC